MKDMPEFYSVTRLKSYSTCPAYYEHKYVKRTPHQSSSPATLLGNFVHEALEQFYRGEWATGLLSEVFKTSSLRSLVSVFNLPADPELLTGLHGRLQEQAGAMEELYIRASADYTGADAIRKGDGSAAIKPESTSAWKKAEAELGLSRLSSALDHEMTRLNTELAGMHPTAIYVEAHNLAREYRHPQKITGVRAVEYGVSTRGKGGSQEIGNPLLMPPQYGGEEGIYLTSYIDLVAEVKGKLAIIDHKTSKGIYTPAMVKHNTQLAAYVWAYQQLTGETVEYIGINQIRSGELVLVPAEAEILRSAFRSLVTNHTFIASGAFPKRAPEDEYSLCLNSYGAACPFLQYCHPHYT